MLAFHRGKKRIPLVGGVFGGKDWALAWLLSTLELTSCPLGVPLHQGPSSDGCRLQPLGSLIPWEIDGEGYTVLRCMCLMCLCAVYTICIWECRDVVYGCGVPVCLLCGVYCVCSGSGYRKN